MAQMIARVIKMEGDRAAAGGMALAAIAPEVQTLKAENARLRRKCEAERAKRWARNAEKARTYKANIRPMKISWYEYIGIYAIGIWMLLGDFARLLVVRED